MSKFTSQEVSALQEGGNERAKEIYFKNWDFQGQPVPDSSDVDRLRNFIKNVYVVRRYTGERIGDHPPQVKGSREDSYGNNNMDSSRGVPRSPYGGASEDNHGPQRSTESSSEDQSNVNRHPIAGRIDQTNRSTTGRENASFRNHQHPDELWKTGGMSENIQKDVTTSVSSVVEPSRVVLPIKLPDPPRSHKATTSTTSTEAQKAAPPRVGDPSSETSRDVKLDISKSLIDFDSDMEPHQGGVQTKMQKSSSLTSADVGWATFDVATPKNATTMPSISSTNSSEGPLLQLPNSVSAPQSSFPTVQTAKSLSFPQPNHGGQQHQLYLSPVDNIQSNNPPLNRASSAPVNSQLWGAASHAPIQGNSALPNNQGSNILIGTRDAVIVSVSQQPVAEVTSSGRKALPEDIFTMSYHPVYASTWDWRANPRVNMGYGQYGMQYPVGSVNTTQSFAHPNSINPFNMSKGPTLAHASTFPSLASMQGASPDMGSMTLLPRAPSMGSVGSVLSPPQVPPSLMANNQYMVQQHAVNMPYHAQNNNFPIGYQGVRGIATTGSAYGLSSMDKRMAAQNLQGMAQSSLPRVGGNPFA